MLNMKNKEDIQKMMKYHRTRDMLNLLEYFKELSPITDMAIVTSIDDYMKNYDILKDFTGERNDISIDKPYMKSVSGGGKNFDIPSIFKKVKEIDPNGVLVLFNLCHEPSERYERYAGISVAVSLRNGIWIDAVGKGFDGYEVSNGSSIHERYYIPWFDIRRCSMENFKEYRTYIISDSDYQKSRRQRVSFLTSGEISLPLNIVEENIPKHYSEIPNFIWLDVMKNLIKKLESKEELLASNGFFEFGISGHTEGRRFLPWQMFDKSRYVLSKTK